VIQLFSPSDRVDSHMDYAVYMDTICHGVVCPWKLYPIDENDIHMDERGNFVMADVFLRITGDQLFRSHLG